jgi:MerR family transcriptional regulator, repressor of the yfmOP operon
VARRSEIVSAGPVPDQAESQDQEETADPPEGGLRISDAASRWGVSARTLRYYEELGLLSPSSYTVGGERRYSETDLEKLGRILELRDVLGMNLDEIKGFLQSERRLDELRSAYRAKKDATSKTAKAQRREILEEILGLNETLAGQLDAKLGRMVEFRDRLRQKADRCRELLRELD